MARQNLMLIKDACVKLARFKASHEHDFWKHLRGIQRIAQQFGYAWLLIVFGDQAEHKKGPVTLGIYRGVAPSEPQGVSCQYLIPGNFVCHSLFELCFEFALRIVGKNKLR